MRVRSGWPRAKPEDARIPHVLYKYRSLASDTGERAHTETIFTHNELYFSLPSQLNDPCDCRPEVSYEARPSQKVKLLRQHLQTQGVPRATAFEEADQLARRGAEALKGFERQAEQRLSSYVPNNVRVLCLCEICDETRMWERYADLHKGICIGFVTKGAPQYEAFFTNVYNVKYVRRKRPVNYYRIPCGDENARRAVLTKTCEWAYEKEWRLVQMPAEPCGVLKFPEGMIYSVIMGAAMSKADREQVLEWVGLQIKPPRIYQAHFGEGLPTVRISPVGPP